MRRLASLAAALFFMLALPAVARAHPLGNFTINRYSLVQLDRGSVRVTFVLDVAEIPTFQWLGGTPTTAEAERYGRAHAAQWAAGLKLTVNGRRIPLVADAGGLVASLRPGQGGLTIVREELPLSARISGTGPFSAVYRDDSFGDRLGWKEIVMRPGRGAVLTASTAATHDLSHMLRGYPKGLLTTPLQVRESRFEYRYGSGTSIRVGAAKPSGGIDESTWGSGFTSLIDHRQLSAGFIALALLIAMFWGALHALTPGHGKSIVAAYLVGSRGTARHAAFLGATVTVTHTAGVIGLGLVALYLSHYIVPETLYPWLSLISGVTVVAVGATILGRRLRRLAGASHDHLHHHHDHHHHGPAGHDHLPPGADGSPITARSLLALGVSGGLLPCPSALVVMLGAIALHRVAFGLVLVVAFSLGLAGTLTSVGLLVVYARRFVDRVPAGGRAMRVLPAFSAGVITVLGVALTLRALDTFPTGSRSAVMAVVVVVVPAAAALGLTGLGVVRTRT
ncbi:MAG: nickel/cobalt transporter, partial [Gaiellales bacterium]